MSEVKSFQDFKERIRPAWNVFWKIVMVVAYISAGTALDSTASFGGLQYWSLIAVGATADYLYGV